MNLIGLIPAPFLIFSTVIWVWEVGGGTHKLRNVAFASSMFAAGMYMMIGIMGMLGKA